MFIIVDYFVEHLNDACLAGKHDLRAGVREVLKTPPNSVENWSQAAPGLSRIHPQAGVSQNRGTPKSSIFRGFPIINHQFWCIPISGTPPIQTSRIWWETMAVSAIFCQVIWQEEDREIWDKLKAQLLEAQLVFLGPVFFLDTYDHLSVHVGDRW